MNVAVYFPSGARVLAELVTDRRAIERGLSRRSSVPDGTGMLFDMGSLYAHRFWMADTWVPLDMVFIEPRYRHVVGVVADAQPLDPTLVGVPAPSRYVLEVPGGWCARNGVSVGQRATVVRLPG